MKKIKFYYIAFSIITLVTCSISNIIENALPIPVQIFLGEQKEGIVNTWKHGAEAVNNIINKVIPISQLPLYYYRAENKIYTLSELKRHGKTFIEGSVIPGTHLENLAQLYGFYDMIDVKHVVCEFFYNSAEIVFYRGVNNFNAEILKEVEKLGVLQPSDIIPLEQLGFDKEGQSLERWYSADKYREFIPLIGDPIGVEGDGKGYRILSKEKVAIKKKYMKLTNDIATLVWHLFFTYEDEYAPRENIVHRRLKREQIRGHLMGNAFVLKMLNDTVSFHRIRDIYLGSDKLNTKQLKKEIETFILEIASIYTKGEVDPFEEQPLIRKVGQFISQKIGPMKTKGDLLETLGRSELDENKARKIIELSMNNWKIVFYLQVSGTLTSTKPAPEFYNHHETEEEKNSHETSDSDTVERDKSKPESPEIIDAENSNNSADEDFSKFENSANADFSKFDDRALEEYDIIAKREVSAHSYFQEVLEDKNPIQDLLRRCFLLVNLHMKKIRAQLIVTFQLICEYVLLNKDECAFIKHAIKNINTYVLKEDGKIASRKYCNEHAEITEIQGVSMAIVEYLILQCEKKQSLKELTKKQKIKLKQDIEILFEENYFLRIFVSKEYREALTNYAEGRKNSKIAKLAQQRTKQIKNGVQLMTKKPPRIDVRDMDNVLIADNSNKREQ